MNGGTDQGREDFSNWNFLPSFIISNSFQRSTLFNRNDSRTVIKVKDVQHSSAV